MSRSKEKTSSGKKGAVPVRRKLSLRKKLLFSLIMVSLVLVGVELALALFGVRPALYEKDPYVGFTPLPLFVEEREDNGSVVMVTAENKLSLFNPQSFPQTKADGTYRIFSVGGSTTHGRPYEDATSFSGWLREYLGATAPDRKWEVINAGGVSYASYRVALLMEQLIEYEPDLFLIYSGHNEFLEERTYGDIKDTPSSLLRISSWAARSRAATLGANVISGLASWWNEPPSKNTLDSEVNTGMIGLEEYERDEELQEKILKHYRYNLHRMIDIAQSVGARVVLVTPASNLLGSSPFKSEHRAGLSESELARWKEYDELATARLKDQDDSSALKALEKALEIDDRHALTHFRRGQALFRMERYQEAKTALVRAMDEDVCPLRALSTTHGMVKEVAGDRDVPVIDFVSMQEERAEFGIPGNEVFLDHVHPTIESHRLLALEILKVMHQQGIVDPVMNEERLTEVKKEVISRIDSAAHGLALMNLSKVLGWAGKTDESYLLAVKAVGLNPDSAAVQYQAGVTSQLVGKLDESIDYYTRVIEIDPTAALAHGNLGVSLEALGYLATAVRHYRLAVKHGDPKDAERNRRNLERANEKLRRSP